MSEDGGATAGRDYTDRLVGIEAAGWRRWVDVQAPYRWHVRRICPGRVLDVGCGIGRNLGHLEGRGVGIDHNADSVAVARARGLTAYTPAEFEHGGLMAPGSFDTLLVAHVLEHVGRAEGDDLLRTYARCVRPGGRVVLICPQRKGYGTDATHVRYVDEAGLAAHLTTLGAGAQRTSSFPFPRVAGNVFTHNEFVAVGTLP